MLNSSLWPPKFFLAIWLITLMTNFGIFDPPPPHNYCYVKTFYKTSKTIVALLNFETLAPTPFSLCLFEKKKSVQAFNFRNLAPPLSPPFSLKKFCASFHTNCSCFQFSDPPNIAHGSSDVLNEQHLKYPLYFKVTHLLIVNLFILFCHFMKKNKIVRKNFKNNVKKILKISSFDKKHVFLVFS